MENSRSRSLVNLKLINGFKMTQMDSNSRCDAKLMGKTLTKNSTNRQNLSYLNHHLIKGNRIHSAKKLTAKGLCFTSPQHETTTPTSQKYLTLILLTYLYSSTYYHNRLLS